MKKPERERMGYEGVEAGHYNRAIDNYERYHDWDIKTNYIHKDRLSVERIKKIILKTCERELNQTIGFMLTEKEALLFATELLNQLKR